MESAGTLGDVIVFGAPGVGKGTQCAFLLAQYGFRHVSTGDLIRSEIKQGSPLGLAVTEVVRRGALVSDELLFSIVAQTLSAKGGLLFDGFPRSVGQAHWLLEQARSAGRRILGVVALTAPDDEIVARLASRRTCSACGAVLGGVGDGGACPKCGGALVRRADDDPAVVADRLRVYRADTAPVLAVLASQLAVVSVDGLGEVAEVRDRVADAVNKLISL